jgi:hypothetical protein
LPGAWDYGLKGLAWALGELDPGFAPQWPGDLEQGLQVMVALWKVLSWLRAGPRANGSIDR